MSSLFAMLDEREADARVAAEELRGQVGKLTEQQAVAFRPVQSNCNRIRKGRTTA